MMKTIVPKFPPTARMGGFEDVARELGIAPKTSRKWWAQGKIPGYRLSSRCVRFNIDEVREAVLKPSRVNAA